MKHMPAQRERRKKDYERVLTLFGSESLAKDKRNKVRKVYGIQHSVDSALQCAYHTVQEIVQQSVYQHTTR